MKTPPLGAELFHADGRTDGRTHITKLIVAFRNFAKSYKKRVTKYFAYISPIHHIVILQCRGNLCMLQEKYRNCRRALLVQRDTYANVISVSSSSRFRASTTLVLLTSESFTLRRPDSGQLSWSYLLWNISSNISDVLGGIFTSAKWYCVIFFLLYNAAIGSHSGLSYHSPFRKTVRTQVSE
jgi:hypothetical protein